jgi:NAD(P)-dependent dehydrogenase (short-subunit alcohol dehydrogenase family)
MSTDRKDNDPQGLSRRDFMVAGAAGVAAAATGLSTKDASAQTVIPDPEKLWTNSKTGRRVALINDALLQIGPPLARNFAKMGYDLVIGQPQEGLVKELEGHGSKVIVIEGVEQVGPNDESHPEHAKKFVDAAIENFGGFDSAYFRTALHGGADILNTTKEQMQASFESNFVAAVYALQAVLPPLMEAGQGQVLILTSASAVRPPYDFVAYTAMRAAANLAIQSASMTAAPKGVCVNAFGTNFLNYPDAVESYGGEEAMAHVASQIPVGRFGEPEEMAHLAMAFLDGKNMYTTGQTIMVAGGYNHKMDNLKFT